MHRPLNSLEVTEQRPTFDSYREHEWKVLDAQYEASQKSKGMKAVGEAIKSEYGEAKQAVKSAAGSALSGLGASVGLTKKKEDS